MYSDLVELLRRIFTKKYLLRAGILTVLVAMFYTLVTYCWIHVNIADTAGRDISVSLTSQSNLSTKMKTSPTGSVRLFVKRGTYEVLVRDKDSSYFTITKANGFFTTRDVKATFTKERERAYIGNNPLYCMSDIGGTLLSYNCEGSFDSVTIHTKASKSVPTTAITDAKAPFGDLGGMVRFNGIDYLLINNSDGSLISDDGPANRSYTIYSVSARNNSIEYTPIQILSDIDNSGVYHLYVFDGKLLLMPEKGTGKSYQLETPTAAPTSIKLADAGKNESVYNKTASSEAIVWLTTTSEGSKKRDFSRVLLHTKDGNDINQSFKKLYDTGFMCGQSVCMVAGQTIDIYTLNTKKLRYSYSVATAWQALPADKGIVFSPEKNGELVFLNTASREGYSMYQLGNYSLVNMVADGSGGFLVTFKNSYYDRFTLHITDSPDTTQQIDKKIDSLRKLDGVKSISVEGSYIYIVPKLGELVYDESTKNFDYDTRKRGEVNSAIDAKISELQIDTGRYYIINTSK